MIHCNNCNTIVTNNFCAQCGQAGVLKKIDNKYFIHEIEHILHFEKGIFYTIKELCIRPGDVIRSFICTNRNKLVKPVIFLLITSFAYTIINNYFHIEDGYINIENGVDKTSISINHWIQNHYAYTNIIMGVFIAFWLKLFFKKHSYNLYELLILLCYVMGIGMLLCAVFSLAEGIAKISLLKMAGICTLGYCVWAIGNFYDKTKLASYVKALLAYLLGMLSFTILVSVLGIVAKLALH